ncbi:hypothetical protein J2T11_003272 [Paenarthrobacter nicotinovorans]|nr:hypothetical protein [Paenarthrobacter nicotinovorans]
MSTSLWRKRLRKSRENESPEDALKRIRRAENFVDLGGGALLMPANRKISREETRAALNEMILVATGGSTKGRPQV